MDPPPPRDEGRLQRGAGADGQHRGALRAGLRADGGLGAPAARQFLLKLGEERRLLLLDLLAECLPLFLLRQRFFLLLLPFGLLLRSRPPPD